MEIIINISLISTTGMCGIIGYISKKANTDSLKLGVEALKRLEYRGYDSSGLAFWDKKRNKIVSQKSAGRIANLEAKINGNDYADPIGPLILHTRWATHGQPSDVNAHPHSDCKGNSWVAHNGIIENFKYLKENLQKEGHRFLSETDTEVIPHLIEKYFKGNLETAVASALKLVKGTYGMVVISKDEPEKIVAARLSSPLILGVGDEEFIIASDPAAILAHTKKVIYLEDKELVVVTPDNFKIMSFDGEIREREFKSLEWSLGEAEKGGYPHFMLKEIMEHPDSITNSLRGRLRLEDGKARFGGLEAVKERLREMEKIQIVACGSASYVGVAGEYMLEEYAGIPVEVDNASEFRYRKPVFDKKTLSIFISQSGETADTLAALREVKEKGGLTLGIVNVVGSSVAREVDAGIYTHAGLEIAVAATKSVTAQLTVMALLALYLGRHRQLSVVMGQRIVKELNRLSELAQKILDQSEEIKKIAVKYFKYSNFFLIGRKYNYSSALEGALKLKETTCIHAEGFSGGELKHGSLALIDSGFPTIAVCASDSVYEKMISNIQEIKARKGPVIAIATEGDEEIGGIADDVIFIPKTLEMLSPILNIISLQLLAYHMGVLRGCDIDKPRNLAKSVTVE